MRLHETEAEFQQAIKEYAMLNGWIFYHTRNSLGSDKGFPDTALVRPGDALILAELKTLKGRPTPEQKDWLLSLGQVTRVETYLWKPDNWDFIEERLRR